MDGTVLIADDDKTIRTVLTQALTRAGCKVHATASLITLLRWIDEGMGDVVISDVMMPDGNGIKTLPKIMERRPDLPVIIISAQNTIMTAVQAEEAKAWDYLPKPFDLPDLLGKVARALELGGQQKTVTTTTPELPLIGHSAAMQELYRMIAKVVNADMPVLITGESGAGKSLVAKLLHDMSERCIYARVTARASDMEDIEQARQLIAKVGQGTLCLEDVGNFSDMAQSNTVDLLEGLPTNGPRIIATLAGTAGGAEMRNDLFFRLAGVTINVPPLADRADDIPLHIAHILPPKYVVSSEAMTYLTGYIWPGNVRQIQNVLNMLKAIAHDNHITGQDVNLVLSSQPGSGAKGALNNPSGALSDVIGGHLQRYFDMHNGTLPPPGLYVRILREMEIPLIEIALNAVEGNQAKCADLLGINRNTLRKKITDHNIEVTRRRKLM